jgi:hypothetical protein
VTRAALLAVLAACGSAPAPSTTPSPPPAARRPPSCLSCRVERVSSVSDLALLAGRWTGSDDEGWRYELEIQIDGTFTQTVHPVDAVACVQEGELDVIDGEIVRTFSSNDCNSAYVGETLHDEVLSLDGETVAMRTASGYEIRYQRQR